MSVSHIKTLQKNEATLINGAAEFQALTIGGKRPVLGSFSKALKGARSLNFGRSGGKNCPTACPYHPTSSSPYAEAVGARCYAATCESRNDRTQLAAKLDRAEAVSGEAVLAAAASELDQHGWRLPWFRFSSFGSVPQKCTAGFRQFVKRLTAADTPIHLPVFSSSQAAEYRRGLEGIGVCVRESVPINEWHLAAGAVSTVAATMSDRPAERIRLAKQAAKTRRAFTGRPCIVCPAVAATHLRTGSQRAKCGACTACSNAKVDIVYPAHR